MTIPWVHIPAAGETLTEACHQAAKQGGWHNDKVTGRPFTWAQQKMLFPVRIALIHSELSEALEADRKNLNDEHIPERKGAEVELADAVIRIFDLAGAMGFDLGHAIKEKIQYNLRRKDHTHDARNEDGGKAY